MSNTEGNHITREAGVDLRTKQNYIVKLTANKVVLASAAADKLIGTLANNPNLAESADIAVRNGNGTGKVVAGGNVTAGDYLTSDANGKAITTTTAGHETIGTAMENGVDGQVIEYLKSNSRY